MKAFKIISALVALSTAIAVPALACKGGIDRATLSGAQNDVWHLETLPPESGRQAPATKGSEQGLDKMKAAELSNLIERLRKGQQVSPEEIDNALQR
jgi:hypothetical protein